MVQNFKMAFSKGMREAFCVTLFNGSRDNDEVCSLLYYCQSAIEYLMISTLPYAWLVTSSLSRVPLKSVTRKASGMALLT